MQYEFQLGNYTEQKYLTFSTKVLTAPMMEELDVKTLRMVATCFCCMCTFRLLTRLKKGPQIAQGSNNN